MNTPLSNKITSALDTSGFLQCCFCLLISAIFILIFSQATTPLYPYIQSDAAIWSIIGKGITEGSIPYADLYDHKGPLLFFLYALGFLISGGKVGLYLVEVVCLAISLWSAYKIARLFLDRSGSLLATLFFLAWCWGTLQGGGTNEELSQPFVMLPMYGILRHFLSKTNTQPIGMAVMTGCCGGLITMIRMNNAAVLCGIAIAVLIVIWKHGTVKSWILSTLAMMAGFLAAIAPFVIYFHLHGCLDYFIQGCFTHNLLYALNGTVEKSTAEELLYLASVASGLLLPILLWREWHHNKLPGAIALMLTSGALLGALTLYTGEGYPHYYQVLAPVFLVTMCFLIRLAKEQPSDIKKNSILAISIVCGCAFLLPFAREMVGVSKAAVSRNLDYHRGTRIEQARQDAISLAQHIPAKDKNKVWGMNLKADVYIDMDITPCFRYFTLQTKHCETVPKIRQELTDWLQHTPPLYIVGYPHPDIAELLSQQYEEIAKTTHPQGLMASLYRRKHP